MNIRKIKIRPLSLFIHPDSPWFPYTSIRAESASLLRTRDHGHHPRVGMGRRSNRIGTRLIRPNSLERMPLACRRESDRRKRGRVLAPNPITRREADRNLMFVCRAGGGIPTLKNRGSGGRASVAVSVFRGSERTLTTTTTEMQTASDDEYDPAKDDSIKDKSETGFVRVRVCFEPPWKLEFAIASPRPPPPHSSSYSTMHLSFFLSRGTCGSCLLSIMFTLSSFGVSSSSFRC